jgi:hypothetical protein
MVKKYAGVFAIGWPGINFSAFGFGVVSVCMNIEEIIFLIA